MIHTQKHCPHCGKLYDSSLSGGSCSGTPIRTCAKCNQYFVDKDYREPAFYDPPAPITFWKIVLYSLWPFGITALMFLVIAFHIDHISGLLLPLFPFLMFLYLVISRYRKSACLDRILMDEYLASKERLANRDYVMLLLDNDCFVPRYFLKFHHPDLVDYVPQKSTLTKHIKNSYMS